MSSSSDAAPGERLVLRTSSTGATLALGGALARVVQPGDALALTGGLGAGKTVFVRGLAAGLESDPRVPVCSPTFTLVNVYPGALPTIHADLYRLSDYDELEAIGFFDYDRKGSLLVVEWADRVANVMPEDHLALRFEVVSARVREIHASAHGPRAAELLRGATAPWPVR